MDSKAKYRDIKERTFEFAVEIVKFCRLLDEKPGVNRACRSPAPTFGHFYWREC